MKDYAKKSSASQATIRKNKQRSRLPLVIGSLCLITLCVMMALRIASDFPASASLKQNLLPINTANAPHALKKQYAVPVKTKKTSNDSVEYDFYQLLPKMTVEIPKTEDAK